MVVTELKLRESYRNEEFSKYYLEKGVILTPSAKQFLHDKKKKRADKNRCNKK